MSPRASRKVLEQRTQQRLAHVRNRLVVHACPLEGCERKDLQLRLDPDDEPGFMRLRICDSGAGMTDEVRKNLFRPFFSTKARGTGTGLGLAVSRSIIDAHRGRISVQSKPGVDTTFTLLLPRWADAQMAPAA